MEPSRQPADHNARQQLELKPAAAWHDGQTRKFTPRRIVGLKSKVVIFSAVVLGTVLLWRDFKQASAPPPRSSAQQLEQLPAEQTPAEPAPEKPVPEKVNKEDRPPPRHAIRPLRPRRRR